MISGDITISKPEIDGLMSNLLRVDEAPAGNTALSEQARQNKDIIGKAYSNELKRR